MGDCAWNRLRLTLTWEERKKDRKKVHGTVLSEIEVSFSELRWMGRKKKKKDKRGYEMLFLFSSFFPFFSFSFVF